MNRALKMTVGQLKRHLADFDDSHEIELSADLRIEELRYIGQETVYLKIAEPCALLNSRFKNAYPEVLAVFFWPTPETPVDKLHQYIELF